MTSDPWLRRIFVNRKVLCSDGPVATRFGVALGIHSVRMFGCLVKFGVALRCSFAS